MSPKCFPPPTPQPTAGGRGGRELCMRRGREERRKETFRLFFRGVCVSLSLSPLRPPTQCGRAKNTGGCYRGERVQVCYCLLEIAAVESGRGAFVEYY